jgi:lipopolysaccharide transport system ATP-binding protein
LIEIAAGFHPDLTGRENVYLQGAIMGMNRQEIATRFDEIVQFAGVGDFVDTPVKRYSSGMNARLGFAVAAHLEPDVLIIDEVLSVGDVTFQQRCLEKMKEFREKGVAIAFVSHNLDAVFSLCSQAILLSRGTVRAAGSAADVLDAYRAGPTTPARSAPNGPALTLVLAESSSGSHLSCLPPGDGIKLRVILAGLGVPTEECFVGMTLWDRLTGAVLHNSHVRAPRAGSDCSHDRIELDFRFCCSLLKGRYRVGFDVFHSQTQSFLLKEDYVCDFEVVENYSYAGIVHIDPEWLFQRTD